MSTLGSTSITTADLRASLDPKGNAARVYEVLEKVSPVINNATWFESNMPNGHESSIQASEETATKRDYERGVPKSKTVNLPVIDLAAQYSANTECDVNKLETYPNPEQYLQKQEHRKIVAMHNDFEYDFFYGNNKTTLRANQGLATRFSSISSTFGKPGYQVVSANGTSSNTSLYLVGFGDDGVNLFYPLGSEAGVTRIVKPQERVTDSSGSPYYAYCIFNNWKVGLCVENYRQGFLRVANISTTALATYGTTDDTSPDLVGIAIRAMERVDMNSTLKYCWFANETVIGYLKTMYYHTGNVNLTLDQAQDGFPQVRLGGIPVYKSYQIGSSEGTIS